MPIIKSAKKRMKQAEKRREYNVEVKSAVKKQIKLVKEQVAKGSVKSNADLVKAVTQIDLAVKKGVLHKRTAARRKSRLTLAYNAAVSKPYGTENPGKPGTKSSKKKVVKKVASKPKAKTATKKATSKKKTVAKKK
jgi:small subunit ribosomal protein S20